MGLGVSPSNNNNSVTFQGLKGTERSRQMPEIVGSSSISISKPLTTNKLLTLGQGANNQSYGLLNQHRPRIKEAYDSTEL